jgi:hypothetical protein
MLALLEVTFTSHCLLFCQASKQILDQLQVRQEKQFNFEDGEKKSGKTGSCSAPTSCWLAG